MKVFYSRSSHIRIPLLSEVVKVGPHGVDPRKENPPLILGSLLYGAPTVETAKVSTAIPKTMHGNISLLTVCFSEPLAMTRVGLASLGEGNQSSLSKGGAYI